MGALIHPKDVFSCREKEGADESVLGGKGRRYIIKLENAPLQQHQSERANCPSATARVTATQCWGSKGPLSCAGRKVGL